MRDLVWCLFVGAIFFCGVYYEKRKAAKHLLRLFKNHCEADANGKALTGWSRKENKVIMRCLWAYRDSYYGDEFGYEKLKNLISRLLTP